MKKLALLSLFLIGSLCIQISHSSNHERTVGFKVGDYFFYSISWSAQSENPEFLHTQDYYLNVDKMNITIQDIYWSNQSEEYVVSFWSLAYFKNGSNRLLGSTARGIETGQDTLVGMPGVLTWFPGCISANLGESDIIYPKSSNETQIVRPYWKVNETITLAFGDTNRETNHLNWTGIVTAGTEPYPSGTFDLYWDKATGALVQGFWSLSGEDSSGYLYDTSYSSQLLDTNSWNASVSLEISILSPENKTYVADGVPLTFTVSEPTLWIGYSLDGQTNTTISTNATLSGLSDGQHNIIVYATDTAGNTGASEKIYFTVDTKPQEGEPFPFEWIVFAILVVVGIGGIIGYVLHRRRGKVRA